MSEEKKPEAQPDGTPSKETKPEANSVDAGSKAVEPAAADETADAPPTAAKPAADASGSETPELAEAAADVGKLPPEAQADKTPLSAETQAAVERAAEKQAASPAAQTTSEPSDAPAAEVQGPSDAEKEAKAKAREEARAARANARTGNAPVAGADAAPKEPGGTSPAEAQEPSDAEKEAKAKVAAEARAARASGRAGKTPEEGAAPKEPSPNQPLLDRLVQIIKESIGEEAVEQAYINETNAHLPVVVIKSDLWAHTALLFKEHDELQCNYLRNLSGVDQETHLEVVYHLLSMSSKRDYCVKVKTDREQPSIPSVTPIWPTANWNEREVYDLFGIHFSGHPDLRRIMMSDDWVGHPLRKDYEPLDPEV